MKKTHRHTHHNHAQYENIMLQSMLSCQSLQKQNPIQTLTKHTTRINISTTKKCF